MNDNFLVACLQIQEHLATFVGFLMLLQYLYLKTENSLDCIYHQEFYIKKKKKSGKSSPD